jgi:hypothetical protein
MGLASQIARARTTNTLQDKMELHMILGGESTLTLLPEGDTKGVEVPCRKKAAMEFRLGPAAVTVR